METIRIIAFIIGILILLTEVAQSKVEKIDKVPACQNSENSEKNLGFKISYADLPKTVFVARESTQEIRGSELFVISRQSFVKVGSKVECASYANNTSSHISFIAPVLIDLTNEQKTKNSFWQFQSMIKENKIGIWNQKTKSLNQNYSFLDWMKINRAQIEFFQISHDQFMLQIQMKINKQDVIQKIYFDTISN